ncbi:hypothetical protein HC766_09015 [Candidatus Gracilibacteria bacterium]|nr:hypothetical protein [Candidatus Gracilibacteria bacterium]
MGHKGGYGQMAAAGGCGIGYWFEVRSSKLDTSVVLALSICSRFTADSTNPPYY